MFGSIKVEYTILVLKFIINNIKMESNAKSKSWDLCVNCLEVQILPDQFTMLAFVYPRLVDWQKGTLIYMHIQRIIRTQTIWHLLEVFQFKPSVSCLG